MKWYNNFFYNSFHGSKKNKNESEIVSETSVIGCMAQVKTKLFIIGLSCLCNDKARKLFSYLSLNILNMHDVKLDVSLIDFEHSSHLLSEARHLHINGLCPGEQGHLYICTCPP